MGMQPQAQACSALLVSCLFFAFWAVVLGVYSALASAAEGLSIFMPYRFDAAKGGSPKDGLSCLFFRC